MPSKQKTSLISIDTTQIAICVVNMLCEHLTAEQQSIKTEDINNDNAQQMGWPQRAIKVLDGDLGISGTQASNREDFKMLGADVSMGKVGAVFVLEASRMTNYCCG